MALQNHLIRDMETKPILNCQASQAEDYKLIKVVSNAL